MNTEEVSIAVWGSSEQGVHWLAISSTAAGTSHIRSRVTICLPQCRHERTRSIPSGRGRVYTTGRCRQPHFGQTNPVDSCSRAGFHVRVFMIAPSVSPKV